MELEYLQKKYPEFIYENCRWRVEGDRLLFDFKFLMGDIEFAPSIAVRGVDLARIDALGAEVVSNLAFNIGLAEIPSYWKAACSPRIVVKAGYLDGGQVKFWRDLIANMGQFFYENNLEFIVPEIAVMAPKAGGLGLFTAGLAERFLVPLGGGKDSLVTLEVIRSYLAGKEAQKEQLGDKLITFTLNANAALKNVAAATQEKNIFVERQIDPRLIELNRQGYFNGHTPFSSILSIMGVALAIIFDCRTVAISQEQSSNEGNVVYRGRRVNHQYSKTFEFENKFRDYSKKYLAKSVEYYSFLRPLFELQIAMIFARYPQYFSTFLSCNRAFTIKNVQSGANAGWCGTCPKCLSIFSMIYPFVGAAAASRIFGQDLFKNAALMSLMRELLGQTDCKPFECVGTLKETRAAFYLSLLRAEKEEFAGLPVLLHIFKDEYLGQYRDIKKESQKILTAWNNQNNLPKDQQIELKNALKSSGAAIAQNKWLVKF